MTAAFEAAHQKRFGFYPKDALLLIDLLTAEAIGSTGETVKMPDMPSNQVPSQQAEMWSQGHFARCHWLRESLLSQGQIVEGPAIISEPTGTNILEQGWHAECAEGGALILGRVMPLKAPRRYWNPSGSSDA